MYKKTGTMIIILVLLAGALGLLWRSSRDAPEREPREVVILYTNLEAWAEYDGTVISESMQVVMSQFKGKTAIVNLVPEGSVVTQGTVLVEFDNTQLLRDIAKLEHEHSSAQATHQSLLHAELPMEAAALDSELMEAEYTYNTEKDYLDDSRELLADNLISTQEVVQQEHKVAVLEKSLSQLQTKIQLTADYLHPARLQRSSNEWQTLKRQLDEAHMQLKRSRIIAPANGMVAYTPLHISGEYRTVRIGDSVNQNQPFMNIPDITNLAVTCYVPEADLSHVQPGNPAKITPVAFPGMSLVGRVARVGAMAQRRPGKPRWQKYFYVTIELDNSPGQLRTGMSAKVSVRSCYRDDVLVLPRTAVVWENGQAFCRLAEKPNKLTSLKLGASNAHYFEVLQGLKRGDRVLLP